jgi:methylmalonyl-CoA/ethylmalonyl-CoA epimerase
MFRIDHLGIAVSDLRQAKNFYELLGMKAGPEETVEHEQVRAVMIPVGESRLELLEPLSPDSVIGRFIERRGQGMHHVALHVDDIAEVFEEMKCAGMKLVSDELKIGAGGHLYFFVHPSCTGGVLVEICQNADADIPAEAKAG